MYSRAIVALLCSISLLFPLSLAIQGLIATIAQFFCGFQLYANWKKNPLPVIGITLAYLFGFYLVFSESARGTYFETSTLLITIFTLSHILENRYLRQIKTRRDALHEPQYANVQRNEDLVQIPASEINVGDIFIVEQSEIIPADGQIEKGESVVDESMLFGGDKAIEKQPGHPIFAGSMNHHGTLVGKATKAGNATFLKHILKNNQPYKTAHNHLITLLCLAIAIATFFFEGFLSALSVLLIASPRAIFLARSLPLTQACNSALAKGIFIKDTKAIEAARKINRIIIDKKAIINEEALAFERTTVPQSYFPIVKTLCQHCDHPAREALLDYLRDIPSISSMMIFRSTSRQGVTGYFDERKYYLGSIAFFEQQKLPTDKFQKHYKQEPGLLLAFATEKLSIGYFILSDQIQSDVAETLLALKELHIQTELLSPDQQKQTESAATALQFDLFQSALQPQDQAKYVQMAKRQGKFVALVGENPDALSAADIGFGKTPLKHILETILLSKTAFQKIRQNLLLATAYNLLLIPLAALGYIHPILAAAAMSLSILLVSKNTLREKSIQIKNELLELEHERSVD